MSLCALECSLVSIEVSSSGGCSGLAAGSRSFHPPPPRRRRSRGRQEGVLQVIHTSNRLFDNCIGVALLPTSHLPIQIPRSPSLRPSATTWLSGLTPAPVVSCHLETWPCATTIQRDLSGSTCYTSPRSNITRHLAPATSTDQNKLKPQTAEPTVTRSWQIAKEERMRSNI